MRFSQQLGNLILNGQSQFESLAHRNIARVDYDTADDGVAEQVMAGGFVDMPRSLFGFDSEFAADDRSRLLQSSGKGPTQLIRVVWMDQRERIFANQLIGCEAKRAFD